ncbi:quinol:cytochrome c oxidoreductase quinone-binding subunit 2 [Ancylomarina subtilis]|uniref:Quinol:cytochrome c oxidoreductase quinone-binding subunit 2 n=1 Tax=Ancylomarina subtilis TaxID=1639035 RepID=A0A4Q7VLH6_9BACT|nr:quinol:cytochrome C oxidoreductase [Ancylomarina subtilis]RZT97102.1 quinol:cytochrome c oxidoreductase quinone-binding subunit 2 [Ancylomarina subtilis]
MDTYILSKKTKQIFLSISAIGIFLIALGFLFENPGSKNVWMNILLNNLYFLFLSLFGALFIALHKIAHAGWHVSLKRIPEALSTFLPYSAVLMFLLVFGMHDLYHWSLHDLQDPIIEGKSAYLNLPFFFIRMAVYFTGWIGLSYLLRKNSSSQDLSNDSKFHKQGRILAGLFMAFFAVSSSTMSWDWIMSVDPHWYSTLFGWFVFIGLFVSGVAAFILIITFLKAQGYLNFVNKEHLHDLGKYLFGFSIFWMYLWFFQYMLIWYGHLPEETIYFAQRLHGFPILFFTILILNFLFPFLALMTRNAKRNIKWLAFVALVVLIGQWLNLYLMLSPGILGKTAQIGLLEIGGACLYLGSFLFVVFNSLSKKPLLCKNDPFLEESFHYET